MVNFLP